MKTNIKDIKCWKSIPKQCAKQEPDSGMFILIEYSQFSLTLEKRFLQSASVYKSVNNLMSIFSMELQWPFKAVMLAAALIKLIFISAITYVLKGVITVHWVSNLQGSSKLDLPRLEGLHTNGDGQSNLAVCKIICA